MPWINPQRRQVDVFDGYCASCDRTGVSLGPYLGEAHVLAMMDHLSRCPDCGARGREVVYMGDPGPPTGPEIPAEVVALYYAIATGRRPDLG